MRKLLLMACVFSAVGALAARADTIIYVDDTAGNIGFIAPAMVPIRGKGDGWLLFHIWLQRFAYRQVFSIVLFKTLKRAIDGKPFNWDKIERTAKMSKSTEILTEAAR